MSFQVWRRLSNQVLNLEDKKMKISNKQFTSMVEDVIVAELQNITLRVDDEQIVWKPCAS